MQADAANDLLLKVKITYFLINYYALKTYGSVVAYLH
jgi:hypothetical protein